MSSNIFFMPFYDVLYGTMVLYTTSQYDKHYVVAHEISLTKNDKQFCIFS